MKSQLIITLVASLVLSGCIEVEGEQVEDSNPNIENPDSSNSNNDSSNDNTNNTSDSNNGSSDTNDGADIEAPMSFDLFVSEDTFVHKDNMDENYGEVESLKSKLASKANKYSRKTLMKFELPEVLPQDLTAELFYYHALEADIGVKAEVSIDLIQNDWSENTVTWNTYPAIRFEVSNKMIESVGAESLVREVVDVSRAVKAMVGEGESEISFSINNHSNLFQTISSREYHNALMGAVLTIKSLDSDNGSGDDGSDSGNSNTDDPTDNNTDSNTDNNTDDTTNSDTDNTTDDNDSTVEEPTAEQIESGKTLYAAQCAGCHGDLGAGEPRGSSIISTLYETDYINTILTTMPFGSAGSCDIECSTNITAWLQTLHANPNGTEDSGTGSANDGSSVNDSGDLNTDDTISANESVLLKRLYKASMNLNSIVPKQSWVYLVKNNGEAGLSIAFDQMMTEESFYQRVKEIYTPTLKEPGYPSSSYVRTFEGEDDWYSKFDDRDKFMFARGASWASLTNSAIELVRYVVKNNKPFTEILTADYLVLNYFGARILNLHDQTTFTEIDDAEYPDLPYSTEEYKKFRSPIVPMAGVLTTNAFLEQYPTSETNVNRHRSYHVYKMFLDTDILEISGSRVDAGDINLDHPTMNNPTCTGCHVVMDPVSSTFRHWQRGPERRDSYADAKWDQVSILEPGFNGELMPEDEPAPLQWLAPRVANDPRFAVATVKTLFEEITGHKVLIEPAGNAAVLDYQRFDYQQQIIKDLADDFIASNHNFKSLVKALLQSEYFNGETYVGGTSRLLPADRFKRKLLATTNDNTFSGSSTLLSNNVYQGEQPNGIMTLIQQYTAAYISCESISTDLKKPYSDRLLLPNYRADGVLFNEDGSANSQTHISVKENIKTLMWVLWGRSVSTTDAAVIDLYETYLSIIDSGISDVTSSLISSGCRYRDHESGERVIHDNEYKLRAWVAILNLMIDDYRYIYE